ncbi:MAG: SDR family oxidoreductase [Paracoccaceae bacterium]
MRIFVTGATGWIGSAVVEDLLGRGHVPLCLVRSEDKAAALRDKGAEAVVGTLAETGVLRRATERSDGVIHLAFGADLSNIAALAEEDRQAIETMGAVLAGSDRPFIGTGGLGLLPEGGVFTEAMAPGPINPAFPRASEQTIAALAGTGLNATWVRNPRSVHGVGETHGFIPALARIAREKGVSAYIGEGQNLWPAVHRSDAARVYTLAVEAGGRGGPFHAVAEEGIPFRAIAETMAAQLGLAARALSVEEAKAHFGPTAMFVGGNGPASSARTRACLGWEPRGPGLIADIGQPAYYAGL